ncbi:hypothetical protein ACK3TF_002891 [Chlorella vulgaris]
MGKKRAPLLLGPRQWLALATEPAALTTLLQEPGRSTDVVRAITQALLPGGALNSADAALRLQVLNLLEQRAVDLCSDAPTDLLRQLYEIVRDRAAVPARDSPATAARMQQAALHTLTQLLVKLDMPQRDARLVKVHVETLFRMMERSGPHTASTPDLCRCAATCLRALEEGAPTLLLAGSKQLLELARVEATPAAESYVTLAARVLSHGAARCLDLKRSPSGEAVQSSPQQEQPCCGAAAEAGEEEHDPYAALAAIDVRALELGAASDSDSGSATPAGARDISPAGTLDTVSPGMNSAFASGRTATSDDFSSPKDVPGSPRAVASVMGTVTTDDSSRSALAAAAAQAAHAAGTLTTLPSSMASEMSGSVQLDGGAAQPLLACPPTGSLRHFRVPQHLHWSADALAHTAVCVYVTPAARQDLCKACLEFLAAMPLLSVEGVACVTSALPSIMRLADVPTSELQRELDALLHSGRTLMLQAVLKLYAEVPEGFAEWRGRLVDSVLLMINGPHSVEQRMVAATWSLVQHHAQMHSRQPSLFAGSWRQLMPRSNDAAQLLSLKIKALSASLAVGIGRAEQICPMVFAWDGFWQAKPTDQQQRLATYALRMLGSAAHSYAQLSPAQAASAQRHMATEGVAVNGATSRVPATPHYVKACLVAACLQLLATRPQYLPAVDAFLVHCSSCCPDLHLTLLNAIDALLSAASIGTFACLQPQRRAGVPMQKQRSGSSRLACSSIGSPDSDSPPDSDSSKAGLSSVLKRVAKSVSKRFSPAASPEGVAGSLQQVAEDSGLQLGSVASGVVEAPSPYSLAAPEPPTPLYSWAEAEAWLWDSRTWGPLSLNMLAHDPLAYRSLLLRLAQSGTAVLPMGDLRFLAAYASQYQGEQPGHALAAKEAGACVLAICQAAAMTHLLIGPQAAPPSPRKPAQARSGRGRARTRGGEECGSVRSTQRSDSPGALSVEGSDSPLWTLQQEEIAAAMQAVLAALTSHFPVESVRRRAQSFLDLLANPSAWDLRLRMGTMAKILGGYFSDAVSMANYL